MKDKLVCKVFSVDLNICLRFLNLLHSAIMLITSELGAEKELVKELKSISCVTGVYEVYGVYDVVAKIESSSREELKETCSGLIRNLKIVRSTLTLVII